MSKIFGLSDNGFKAKSFLNIKQELEDILRKEVDPTLHFGPGSVAGMLTGIIANQTRQVWEALQGLYHSLQPHTASGAALDALCSLTGTYRKQAQKSRVMVALTLGNNTRVPKGSRIQSIAGHNFVILADVINNSNIETTIEIEAIADEVGPIMAHKDTASKIMTPIAGWSKAVFKDMLKMGCFREEDSDLRLRRLNELSAKGCSTLDAIKARVLSLPNVEAVYIKENNRSFEAIVKGGLDDDIAQSLWDAKPLGVETVGKIAVQVKDSWGEDRDVYFSRPTIIELSLSAKVLAKNKINDYDRDIIKNAIADYALKHFTLGSKVYASQFYPVLLSQNLIKDVLQLTITEKSNNKPIPSDMKPEEMLFLPFNNIAIEWIL